MARKKCARCKEAFLTGPGNKENPDNCEKCEKLISEFKAGTRCESCLASPVVFDPDGACDCCGWYFYKKRPTCTECEEEVRSLRDRAQIDDKIVCNKCFKEKNPIEKIKPPETMEQKFDRFLEICKGLAESVEIVAAEIKKMNEVENVQVEEKDKTCEKCGKIIGHGVMFFTSADESRYSCVDCMNGKTS